MRALLGLIGWTHRTTPAQEFSFDEARGQVCGTACRANAAVDRARTSALTLR